MKLSIITINYNNAAGLKKTLDSVAIQTYTDFEYIIVDGASSDGSVDIIREYDITSHLSRVPDKVHDFVGCSSPLASRLKWISEKDTGIYNAMNKGIKMASGEYLLFLNSGDFLVNGNVLAEVFQNDCYSDILCARCNVSDNGKVIWTSNPPEKVTFGTLYLIGLAHQSTFIRKSLFEQYGYYDESYRYNADIEFWYRSIIEHAVSTQRIDVITTDYNLDGISSTESRSVKYKEEMDKILAPYCIFTKDYDFFNLREKDIYIYDWLKSKTILYKLNLLLYKIDRKLFK